MPKDALKSSITKLTTDRRAFLQGTAGAAIGTGSPARAPRELPTEAPMNGRESVSLAQAVEAGRTRTSS